jgi:hypothetical protein
MVLCCVIKNINDLQRNPSPPEKAAAYLQSLQGFHGHFSVNLSSVPDPEYGSFLTHASEIRMRDPGWKKIRIRDEHPRSFFRELRNNFLGSKILKFFDADPDPGSGMFLTPDPGSGREKFGSRIWEKHPESATLNSEHKISDFFTKHLHVQSMDYR